MSVTAVVSCSIFVFFFSSRRRHTRCLSDWSSDVCSSDLGLAAGLALLARDRGEVVVCFQLLTYPMLDDRNATPSSIDIRSEERRVGKECRARGSRYH